MLRIVLVSLNKSKTFLLSIVSSLFCVCVWRVCAALYCIELKIKKEKKSKKYLFEDKEFKAKMK